MQNLIKSSVFVFVLIMTMTSCGVNYNFDKVVVNNTGQELIVQYDCCGNEKEFVIPAYEQRTVFQCIYQSYKKPDCADVEGKFSMTFAEDSDAAVTERAIIKQITDAEHWIFTENGKNLSCVFTIEAEDIK